MRETKPRSEARTQKQSPSSDWQPIINRQISAYPMQNQPVNVVNSKETVKDLLIYLVGLVQLFFPLACWFSDNWF